MPWSISKTFYFEAAHQLAFLPPTHKCSRVHGHSYEITLVLQAEVLTGTMLVDYAELDVFREWLMRTQDHRNLNETMRSPDGLLTTAESLAAFFWERINTNWPETIGKYLALVSVKETRDTEATYWEPEK